MHTRTIMRHQPSGEMYVVEYDDHDAIDAISDPLYYADADALTDATIWDVEVSGDDVDWARGQLWVVGDNGQ